MAASIEGDESVNPANTHTYSITEMEGFMYHWLVMGGEITSGLGTETIDIKWGETMAGLIQVVIETDQGCVSDTAHLSIAINTVGIEGRSGHEIGIYPNPVQNILHISSSDRIHFSLTDLAGTTLMTTSDNQIDLSSLKEGIYIAVIRSNDRITTQKIIKQ
ncbi:MAG: hypothetical protein DRI70_04260 [Bacteroidetes bacterium]|nr:MAG: hypothetical protein DRI70_04260 [Bacteroidota bacterium]